MTSLLTACFRWSRRLVILVCLAITPVFLLQVKADWYLWNLGIECLTDASLGRCPSPGDYPSYSYSCESVADFDLCFINNPYNDCLQVFRELGCGQKFQMPSGDPYDPPQFCSSWTCN